MTEAGKDRRDQSSEGVDQNDGDSRQQQRPSRTARTNPASGEKGKLRQSREPEIGQLTERIESQYSGELTD